MKDLSINQSAVSGAKAERFVENSVERLIDGYITDKEKIKNIIKENIEYDEYVEWIELFGSDTMTVSGLDQIVSNMVRTAVSRRGRVIDDIVYSAQEVQDSLLRVNRACLDRGYDVMKKTMGIHNPMSYLMSCLINLANNIDFTQSYEDMSIDYDVRKNVLHEDFED